MVSPATRVVQAEAWTAAVSAVARAYHGIHGEKNRPSS